MLYSFIEYVVSLPQEMDFEGGALLCHSHTAKQHLLERLEIRAWLC